MSDLPVIVIGAGPVGLAAAAHLLERGLEVKVLEAGPRIGQAVAEWGHVQMFSPWRFNIDAAARRLLETEGWKAPDPEHLPTGAELVRDYLQPLAATPALQRRILTDARAIAITRQGFDKVKSSGRDEAPFLVRFAHAGEVEEILARAVIDASGTWASPNPIGASGLPATGEAGCRERIHYGIPDVRGAARPHYAGKRVLVVGAGHSAMNAVLDLMALAREEVGTKVTWALRRSETGNLFGGGDADRLSARGELGNRARHGAEAGEVEILAPFKIRRVSCAGRLRVEAESGGSIEVDRIIAATGFRPDLEMLRELRLGLDPWLEAPLLLAPMIDPNLHSCGTVRPHGARELQHPESNFFIVGMKSYGRAPTFLLATGYEQVRSVAASLAGDRAAAARVELALPETGVCSAPPALAAIAQAGAGCCGPAPAVKATSCKPKVLATTP